MLKWHAYHLLIRGVHMEKYNLDEKGGLFKFVEKKPSKVVKNGDIVELRHFGVFGTIRCNIISVDDSTLKIQASEKNPDVSFSTGDHLVLSYESSKDVFVIVGEIASVDSKDPLEITISVNRIEKLKDNVKEKKYFVSLPVSLKIIGIPENKMGIVKNISFGGIKFNCNEDIMMEDIVDATIQLDKQNKLPFKGRVVRKNHIGNYYEYGLEFAEMVESSNKLLTRTMYELESSI